MYFVAILILILVAIVLVILILAFALFSVGLFFELPYVATKEDKVKTIIKLAGIKKGETVIDLGSGDGRLLFAAAKLGATAVGYELNPLLVIITTLRARIMGLSKNVIVKKRSLWEADLKTADAVFVYGRKHTMKRFEDFVYKNCKKGTRITVNSDKTVAFPSKKALKSENGIFLYRV
ncbi:MAG: hypothetical protein UT84_C0006G0008 [Candidatus Curtissbacteria bacterium GW2011_GWA1_40_16]|uniref:Methyltransferase domain-containing protein n=1 Tax=Candidatus Curtissbacteria bacterium GW2011_GWA1_40_16 TaxID=1618405 RepID=A0A0G0RLP5_9BACT|nr:MAG: hypothetical protein UT84_C0006G0008 [Candidatus Curtissbacteria bacterium GW2011_GWA1_40_16]